MVIDWQISERLQCSSSEKQELIPLVDYVVQTAEKARREGLLSLEDDIEACEYPLLALGLQLVVDGTDPALIDSILTARIVSSDLSGQEFLSAIISYTAALAIQQGNDPRLIEAECFAYFGNDADAHWRKFQTDVVAPRTTELVDTFEKRDGDFAAQFPDVERLTGLDDRSIQKILREIDMNELVAVVAGCTSAVRQKIVRNMSTRAAALLATEAAWSSATPDLVRVTNDKLFAIIEKLVAAGEIPSLPQS